eukprot:1504831-Pleurochrysis_carterae.AAC.1
MANKRQEADKAHGMEAQSLKKFHRCSTGIRASLMPKQRNTYAEACSLPRSHRRSGRARHRGQQELESKTAPLAVIRSCMVQADAVVATEVVERAAVMAVEVMAALVAAVVVKVAETAAAAMEVVASEVVSVADLAAAMAAAAMAVGWAEATAAAAM